MPGLDGFPAIPAHAMLPPGMPVNVIYQEPKRRYYLVRAGETAGWIKTTDVLLDPLLLVDAYWANWGKLPRWERVAVEPWYVGAILKATQGTRYVVKGDDKSKWFIANWKRLRDAGGERYGKSWFRGAYHWLIVKKSPEDQADYFLGAVDKAGGWGDGDIMPIVDLEEGGNEGAEAKQVIDATRRYIARVTEVSGRRVILYAGSFLRALKIKDRMGAAALWTARYGPKLPATTYQSIGWKLDATPLWQYAASPGSKLPKRLPHGIKGYGTGDTSVFLDIHHYDVFRRRLCGVD